MIFGSRQAWADELVVDNTAPQVQVTGPWLSATEVDGFVGPDYVYRPAGSGAATVFWPWPATAPAGRYEVFARWTSGDNRATNAVYFVTSNSGTAVLQRNQQTNGGTWQSLGSFDFQAGRSQGVTLTDNADGVVVADAVRFVGPADASTTTTSAATTIDASGPWTVTLDQTDLHAGPDATTDVLARVPQFSYLQVVGYSGDWAYVYNPRAHGTAYTPSAVLGPSDPPPAWVTAPPPTPQARIEALARTVGSGAVAFYPADDKFAYIARLGHNAPIVVHDRVTGVDGSTWYRIDQGYLPASAVRLPRKPDRTYAGRWIDADLSEPAMLTAYEGDRVVLATLAIKGTIANQTPTGVFSIGRRVADETMDSGTLGVPSNGPGGYHLEHVLNTQYFTADGASIHYNYWSSNFGYSGSHGCLGVNRADSEFLWNWATLGTPVVIHQ